MGSAPFRISVASPGDAKPFCEDDEFENEDKDEKAPKPRRSFSLFRPKEEAAPPPLLPKRNSLPTREPSTRKLTHVAGKVGGNVTSWLGLKKDLEEKEDGSYFENEPTLPF